jgi:hypothetical protein
MCDPIQQFAGANLENLHACWHDLKDQISRGLFGSLQTELQSATKSDRSALKSTGRYGADEWINTACQLVGSAGRCTTDIFGDAMPMTRITILMYVCFVYLRESCIIQWREALSEDRFAVVHSILQILTTNERFRRIRNAVSHARWAVSDDGRSITFNDGRAGRDNDWTEVVQVSTVTTDCLIIGTLMIAFSELILERADPA